MNRQDYFQTKHLDQGLEQQVARGGVTTIAAQLATTLISLASVVILARLLRPQDFGLIAMVTGVTGILEMFKDAGLSTVTIQKEGIGHHEVSNLFWLNSLLSLVIALVFVLLAPLLANFYQEPKVFAVTLALGVIFVLGGLTVQHQALLRRQMRFAALARIQVTAQALALVVAVMAARAGYQHWALVIQIAVSQVLVSVLTLVHCRWIPSLPRRGQDTFGMARFGGYLTGFSFVNYLARNADRILIGKFWGGSNLGFYTKAYGLLLLPLQQINGPISAVATPALSRLQDDPRQFRELFKKVLGSVCFLTFPLIAWMIMCRREIVLLVLGPPWEPAIPIFGALAFSAFFQPIGNITGVLYVALGRPERMFKWGLMSSASIVAAFFAGLPFGPLGVAWAYSITIFLIIIPLILYGTWGTPVRLVDYWDAARFPAVITLAGVLMAIAATEISGLDQKLLPSFMITSIVFAASYLGLTQLLKPHIFREVHRTVFAGVRRREMAPGSKAESTEDMVEHKD